MKGNRLYWFIALLVAMTVSIFMVYAAIEHNPQGEFKSFETGELKYFDIGGIFFSWWIFIFILFGLIKIIYTLCSIFFRYLKTLVSTDTAQIKNESMQHSKKDK